MLACYKLLLSITLIYSFLQRSNYEKGEINDDGKPAKVDAMGRPYWYEYKHGPFGQAWSILGGLLVGLTGIGIGELTSTTLIVRNRIPVRIAIGTGIMVVALTVFPATLVHAFVFSAEDLNVHWNILFMTAPAVACGGQVSPFINNRIAGEKMKIVLSIIFLLIGGLLLYRSFY